MTAKQSAARNAMLKRKYSLSLEDYAAILKVQKGVCAICKNPEAGKAKRHLHVDHDHSTHLVRGILCWSCNKLLPARRDLVDLLTKAAGYVADPPALKAVGVRYAGKRRVPK